jgi:D-glycero-D-manno-heptose 1,7-bisphosphate phosphatase
MILRASQEMSIELAESYMIGDRFVDVQAAHGAGVKSVLLRSGDGLAEIEKFGKSSPIQPHFIADNLLHAVEAILNGLVK